jgi:undecaprenyl-diphosphatase
VVATAVVTGSAVVQWDIAIATWFSTHDSAVATWTLRAVSVLHNEGAVALYGLALAYWLFVRRNRFWSMVALCAIPSGMLLNFAVKHMFMRPRPSFELAHQAISSYSFPSGHTEGVTLFYGVVVCALLSGTPTAARRLAAAACVAMVFLVAFSRVYLGAHYPSDVTAAMLEGIAWLGLVIAWRSIRERKRLPQGPAGVGVRPMGAGFGGSR